MNGQHFKELIETVSLTTGLSKSKIAILIGCTNTTIQMWQMNGLPNYKKPMVMKILKQAILHPYVSQQSSEKTSVKWLQIARENGIPDWTYRSRIHALHWDIEKAATEPVRRRAVQ